MTEARTRPPAQRFEDLLVWRRAHEFVLGVYRHTKEFPKQETYGLTAQFRDAAVSVAANVAEGFKRRGPADKRRFINTAQASLEECRYYLLLARDLGYGETPQLEDLTDQVGRLLQAYYAGIGRDHS